MSEIEKEELKELIKKELLAELNILKEKTVKEQKWL